MAKATKTLAKARAKTKIFPFDAAETLDTPEAIAEYLSAAFETNDPSFIAKAVGTAARARGMSDIAREAGLSRENLYRSLDGETRAEFGTIVRVLDALGVRLTAAPKPI
jgi:probable addiction module antidote protein